MTAFTDRIAVVVARHSAVTGLGYSRTRCGCGEVFSAPFVKSHAAHVAEQVAAELQLTEELGAMFTDRWEGTNHSGVVPGRRWVSAWSAVEEKP